MHALHNGQKMLITDCSKLNFKIWLQNENFFKLVKVESRPVDESENDGTCAVVNLHALNEGSTLNVFHMRLIQS
jgi:hypothetical protein